MLARPPPLFPPAPSFLFSPLPVQLGSSYLGELHQRSNHPEVPWAPPSVTTAPMRKMAQHDHLRASASCPTTPFLFHGLALDDDAGRRHSFVKCLSFPDRQCPAHATNLDAAPLRPSSKHSEPINRSTPLLRLLWPSQQCCLGTLTGCLNTASSLADLHHSWLEVGIGGYCAETGANGENTACFARALGR
jgi:hypothetical protein